jgi:CHASE3 domain sensor protein
LFDHIINFFRKIASPFLNWWHRLPLKWKGWITILLPITAIVVSSSFAYLGNLSRESIETDIARRFALVSNLNEVLTLMVNAETGVRGYQLTKREEFLQPYQLAQANLPGKIQSLQSLIQAEPGEKPRVEKGMRFAKIQELIKNQMNDLEWQKNYRTKDGKFDEETYSHIMLGKGYMDEIRLILGNVESRENELLAERINDINSIRRRDYLVVLLTLFIALITRLVSWYLFDTGIKQRILQAVEKMRNLRKADDTVKKHKEEIDILEEEIENICRVINANSTKPE